MTTVGGKGGIGPAWTRGEIEAPAGEKQQGSHTVGVYTTEQQARLNVNENGKKIKWPELEGKDGEEAVATIKSQRPDLNQVVTMKSGSMMTMDMREDRVRVMVDDDGKVVGAARIG